MLKVMYYDSTFYPIFLSKMDKKLDKMCTKGEEGE